MPEPPDGVAFSRRAVYLDGADALVLADVHLGRDERSAVQLPLGEYADVRERLDGLLERFEPAEVVVAGDLLHSFGHLPDPVAEDLDAVARTVSDAGAELVVTPGNHDVVLDAAFDGPTPGAYRLDDGTVVCHGHEDPGVDAVRYVAGHDHPTVEIEGQRHPCFLYGEATYRDGDVVVLPAFSRLAPGTTINGVRSGDVMSPLLAGSVGDYRPIVFDERAGEPLAFPPLAALREHL